MIKKNDYQELLKDPRWIKKRNQILSRDKNTCQFCGCQDKYMQVHHKRYIKGNKPWEYEDKDLITLCGRCHEMETEFNGLVYEDYKQLRDVFKRKGLSMTLLDVILTNITDAITREEDENENATDSTAYEYVYDCICGTQIISDIYAAKQCGFDMRTLMQNCYPTLIVEYDNK